MTADDVVAECDHLRGLPYIRDYELLRIYYYDASPSSERVNRPVSRTPYNLGETERYRRAESLYSQLVLKSHFALRLGHVSLSPHRWKLKPTVARQLVKEFRPLSLTESQSRGLSG